MVQFIPIICLHYFYVVCIMMDFHSYADHVYLTYRENATKTSKVDLADRVIDTGIHTFTFAKSEKK